MVEDASAVNQCVYQLRGGSDDAYESYEFDAIEREEDNFLSKGKKNCSQSAALPERESTWPLFLRFNGTQEEFRAQCEDIVMGYFPFPFLASFSFPKCAIAYKKR